MGRTVPTYVNLIAQVIERWSKFRRALRREDQSHFDRLVRAVRYFSPSGMYQSSDDPRESVVLSMFLDLQKRVTAVEDKLKMPELDVPVPEPGDLFLQEPEPEEEIEDPPELK